MHPLDGKSRRSFLAGLAGAAGATAGCLDDPPVQEAAAGVVPVDGGYLAGGTTAREAFDTTPRGTWVAGLARDGGVRWHRHHGPDRWPGDDRVLGICPLADGALLYGHTTREAVIADDGLVHAVDAGGRTRWHRTVEATTGIDAAVADRDGAVVAGTDRPGSGPPSLWVAGLAPDGRARWERTMAARVPATLYRPGDGTAVLAGHAVESDHGVPWLAVLGADGGVRATRRYDAGDTPTGDGLVALLDGPDGPIGVATALDPKLADGPAARVLTLDGDWRVGADRPLDIAADVISAAGEDDDGNDPVRFVGAIRAPEALVAVLGEGGWTTVASFDGSLTRMHELLLQGRTTGVHRPASGGLLLGGSHRAKEGDRDVRMSRVDVHGDDIYPDWTTTLSPAGE